MIEIRNVSVHYGEGEAGIVALSQVNLRAEEDKRALEEERAALAAEKDDLTEAIRKLRAGIGSLNREGRERL